MLYEVITGHYLALTPTPPSLDHQLLRPARRTPQPKLPRGGEPKCAQWGRRKSFLRQLVAIQSRAQQNRNSPDRLDSLNPQSNTTRFV